MSFSVLPVRAEQNGPNPQVSLFGGGQTGNNEFKAGPAMTAALGARLNPYMSLDVQGGWIPAMSKQVRLSDADLTLTSIEFVSRLYAPLGRLEPYIAAGAGRFFISEQLKTANTATTSRSENVNSQWGGLFGGGLDFVINESISFGFDLSYIYLRTSADTAVHSSASVPGLIFISHQPLNLDMIRMLAGLRVKFNSPGWKNVYN